MLHREYGATGKKLSVIGLGGMRFVEPEKIEQNAEIVLHAYDRGVTYFDTAPGYCMDKSEDIVGAAIKQMKPGTFTVSTKTFAGKPDEFRAKLERSIERLHVDRIDVYHIWCVVSPEAWEQRKADGVLEAAARAKEDGLADHIAISAHLCGSDVRKVLAEAVAAVTPDTEQEEDDG